MMLGLGYFKCMNRVPLMNIAVDNVSMSDALVRIDALIQSGTARYVVTPNVDHIVRCERDKEFASIYQRADLVLADGKPLLWISKMYGVPIEHKISGSDLFPKLCDMAGQKGYTMFLLGAGPGVADLAAKNLMATYPSLHIVGTYSPPFGFESDSAAIGEIIDVIKGCRPDILVVGLGSPKQEKFISKYLDTLGVPVSLGLGASIDFEAGTVVRAPRWISELGFEWLWRLCHEPKRLAKRYLVEDVKILPMIFKYWPKR